MSADAWLTLAVVIVTIVLLATERASPAVVMLAAVILLLVTGVIDETQAFAGFSNSAPITIAGLYVLAGATDATGALEGLTRRLLGTGPGGSPRRALARVVLPGTLGSAFIANTPLVSMVAPRVVVWARRSGVSPSRFLMPLSYAAVFGGVITVIGTSTNLTVSGLLTDAGQPELDLFEITPVGLPLALLGAALLIAVTPRLLPDRSAGAASDRTATREFTVEMEVAPGSPMVGRSVTHAGLRNLDGVFLVEIDRTGSTIAPVGPDEILNPGDRLTFAGNVDRVLDLQRLPGLVSAEHRHFSATGSRERGVYEVVVAESSPLVGTTLKEVGFRSRYSAAVLAIHRSGVRLEVKLGEVRLRGGDLLLVLADSEFPSRYRDTHDFLVVSAVDGAGPLRRERARFVELVTLALIVTAGTGVLSLLEASLLAAAAVVLFGAITLGEARRAIDLEIIVLIAASFGLGAAMKTSGLAEELGRLLVDVSAHGGDIGILAGVLIATLILTELLSNNAAAVLMFPIALAVAAESGLESRPLAIAILMGSSCSFLTPIGYQTNLLVFGMGGYRFRDFTRLGAPCTLLTVVVCLVLIPVVFPLR